MAAGITPEVLLAEAAWLERLAVTLAGDRDDADDLVQESWIAAWRRNPDTSRPLRPSLAKVVRDRSLMRRRSNSRRANREASAQQADAPTTPDELLDQVRLHRLLVDLVLELDEPYRSTVLARFVDGQTSAAIAKRLNVPESTVRWRLHEALAKLRVRLDELNGDRKQWTPAVLAFAQKGVGVAKSTKLTLGLVALLVLLLGGAALWRARSNCSVRRRFESHRVSRGEIVRQGQVALVIVATWTLSCASNSQVRQQAPRTSDREPAASDEIAESGVPISPDIDAGVDTDSQPDLSFLAEPAPRTPVQRPVQPDGTCDGIIGLDGECCSLIRVDGCTDADIEADRAKKEHATSAWLASLESSKESHGKYPTNYASLVRSYFAATLKDPYSARYGRVSKPRKEHAVVDMDERAAVFGWSVCASVNAKNGFGAYVGNAVFWLFIANGKVVRTLELETGEEEIHIGRPVNCADGP